MAIVVRGRSYNSYPLTEEVIVHPEKCSPWFAVYVKTRHEKSVELALKGKGLDAFVPTYTSVHKNRKKFELPVFPNYVFSRIDLGKTLPVMTIPGVFFIVGTGREPRPIPDAEIEDTRAMLSAGHKVSPWPYVSPGQEVYMRSGPLRGIRGTVVNSHNDRWLVISVHLLQRSIAVKVDRESLAFGTILAYAPTVRVRTCV